MADSKSLIRVGVVSAVDSATKKCRVYYPGMSNLVSDWLPVLQFPPIKASWVPAVNNKVLVVMECGFNSGGYIVGVIL